MQVPGSTPGWLKASSCFVAVIGFACGSSAQAAPPDGCPRNQQQPTPSRSSLAESNHLSGLRGWLGIDLRERFLQSSPTCTKRMTARPGPPTRYA
jgi:hypothetical protein